MKIASAGLLCAGLLGGGPGPLDGARLLRSQTGTVEYVGGFAEFRETGEHVYGYQLQLWRDRGELVGLWSKAEGQPADFPTVLVEHVRLGAEDGSLRFSARWCDEVEKFEGTWKGDEIAGELRGSGEPVRVTLRRGDSDWPPTSRAEWKLRMDKVVRIRAPRCP